ncbi:MAG: hypothetical protein QOC99_3108 [Acidobacteriota bacterium]|nr:hypothetical protein [Acidobacteriota bacterium]
MNRADFQKLSRMRLKEANILLDNKSYEGAYYLAGYAVECALKACIARKTKRYEFPPKRDVVDNYYKHNLELLIRMAGLELELKNESKSVAIFDSYWNTVKAWSEQARYETKIDQKRAQDLYVAVSDVPNGVLVWLKKYW